MLPWNYGFEWNTAHVTFLGAFYAVLAIVATTVVRTLLRTRRDLRTHRAESIRWQSDFHDLPPADRVCRHVLTGEIQRRECPNAFDCRACETHARLIAQHPVAVEPQAEDETLGMPFPLDRYYHRGHAWVHPEPDGSLTIGLDELGWRLAGAPDAIGLPKPGAAIHVNGPAFHLHRGRADVRVLSPVDGEVIGTGSREQGWLLRVKPAATGERAFRHLLRGAEIRPWLVREMERLQLVLTPAGAAPTLADGGVPMPDITAGYADTDWDDVCGEMFLCP